VRECERERGRGLVERVDICGCVNDRWSQCVRGVDSNTFACYRCRCDLTESPP
jgi:hypothetical protein